MERKELKSKFDQHRSHFFQPPGKSVLISVLFMQVFGCLWTASHFSFSNRVNKTLKLKWEPCYLEGSSRQTSIPGTYGVSRSGMCSRGAWHFFFVQKVNERDRRCCSVNLARSWVCQANKASGSQDAVKKLPKWLRAKGTAEELCPCLKLHLEWKGVQYSHAACAGCILYYVVPIVFNT